jgi:hypothetical protein
MFYDVINNKLLNECPLNGYLPDGVLVQGLNITNFETQKACGILPVLSDEPEQPLDHYEDVEQRIVTIEDNGVLITRTWLPNPIEPITIPTNVSARQIRLWLIENNIPLALVESAINEIQDSNLREKTLVEWEYAPYVERNHPLINTLGQALGLNSEQIDAAFVQAYQL